MKKINFVNNDAPYLSAENLNQMQDNIEEAINGVVLFESAEGDNSTSITLNETLANYKEIEIVFGNAGLIKSVKAPKGFTIELSLSRTGRFDNSYYGVRKNTTNISFNGTTATKPIGYTFTYKVDNTMVFSDTLNEIFIYKIVGYK